MRRDLGVKLGVVKSWVEFESRTKYPKFCPNKRDVASASVSHIHWGEAPLAFCCLQLSVVCSQ